MIQEYVSIFFFLNKLLNNRIDELLILNSINFETCKCNVRYSDMFYIPPSFLEYVLFAYKYIIKENSNENCIFIVFNFYKNKFNFK